MAKKGKKKGKKGKKEVKGPEQVTTMEIINERSKMLCPRMGDMYTKSVNVETILQDVAENFIEKVIDNQLSTVSLCNMKLCKFPTLINIRSELDCLVELNLSKNNLFNGDEIFKSLSVLRNLKRLNLSENFLNGMLSTHVGLLTKLEVFNLDVNNLSSLCPAIQQWENIKVFTISDNSLTSLPQECSKWQTITILNMKNNKITDIGNLPQYWPNLERLYLGTNLINTIPFEIGNCKELSILDLSCNGIQTLPLSLANCSNLQYLFLGSNKIEYLPPEIFVSLTKLTELHLYKNKITVIPVEVKNLQAIKKISLASNNLRGLPDEIGECTTLEELYLSNNAKFSYFPGSAGHLRRLKELSLAKCPALKQLPNTAADMTSLKELDLRAAKKQVCKITPELVSTLKDRYCKVRGGVVKKAKGKKGKKTG